MSPHLRVISLAPTQTEIIAALGHLGSLLGVTESCDYPEEVRHLPRFGSWYAPDLRKIMEVGPGLVCTFGSHQEEVASTLQEEGLRVYHSAPPTVEASLRSIEELAELLESPGTGRRLLEGLRERLAKVEQRIEKLSGSERPTVLRIMNWEPLVTVGPGAFQHDVIELAGGRNIMADAPAPYVAFAHKEVQAKNPQVIFFCESFIGEKLRNDPCWSEVDAVRSGRLYVFDCGLTCRSGPRIVDMVEGLARALHPNLR